MVVVIDGPAGAGKSTVARRVAKLLGWRYLDTGAMYRALTLKALRRNVDLADDIALADLCGKTSLGLAQDSSRVLLDGENVSDEIREPRVTAQVKHAAASAPVRTWMRELQRTMARHGNLVAEGRDMGTVVFPAAEMKFYLDASLEERARRRQREWQSKGVDVSVEEVQRDMAERDRTDETREVAPLRRAPGAVHVDTTGMSIDDVVIAMLREIRRIQKEYDSTQMQ